MTDRRTDRILITIPRLHYMQCGKNPSMLSRVIAKNVGDVFLRHSVEQKAKLSQRDHATAVQVSFGQNISGRHADIIGLPSTAVT